MTFLAKLGAGLLKGVAIVSGFGGLISQTIPGSTGVVQTVSKDLAQVAKVVADIEAIGQLKTLPGPEKAKAAGPLIAQIILQSTLMSGQKIQNPDLFNQGCVNIGGGVADVLNSLHPDGVQLQDLVKN